MSIFIYTNRYLSDSYLKSNIINKQELNRSTADTM